MENILNIADIAKDLRKSKKTVIRLVKSGSLPAITIPRKSKFQYVIPWQTYFDWKRLNANQNIVNNHLSNLNDLNELKLEWLKWCENGNLTGKPLSPRTMEIYTHCLDYYLAHIPRRYGKTPIISLDFIRYVFGNISPERYSLKFNIHSAVKSFLKYLIAKNLVNKNLLDEVRQFRPKRVYPPKRTHCTLEQFNSLLLEASKWHRGQSNYDVLLNKTLVAILGYAGLRNGEVTNLRLQDVDLTNKRIFVYLGKGKKNRYVGICNSLYDNLLEYLSVRPRTNLENFFVTVHRTTIEARPFDRYTLQQKIKRLSKRVEINVTPHGLRRTFATINANAGKPLNIISLALGHSDLKTTQGYLMTTQDEVVKEMQGW
ncbi:MAG: tyrosine-type recombinase/integrase [Candidatus Melainabacteria bacterium]|nr:tyrosine-type recombinase/integrase [Candidatus Melainabacteria bacterium]